VAKQGASSGASQGCDLAIPAEQVGQKEEMQPQAALALASLGWMW
jgi:hypothetical protein